MTNTDLAVLEALDAEIPGIMDWARDGDHDAVSPQDRITEYLVTLNRKEAERSAAQGRETQYATFELDRPGRKFTRVVMVVSGSRSVHAFVDKDAKVYKAAGWARPADGVRYDLMNTESRARCFDRAHFAGGYLYADQAAR